MKRTVLDFILSLLFSIAGFHLIFNSYIVLERHFDIDFGGDKGNIFSGLFLGLPLGSIIGILLSEKLIFKSDKWNILGIILACALSFLGNLFGLVILDKIGGLAAMTFIILLISVICVFSYKMVLRSK